MTQINRPLISSIRQFTTWLKTASRGDRYCYHEGSLIHDRSSPEEKGFKEFPSHCGRWYTLNRLANMLYDRSNRGRWFCMKEDAEGTGEFLLYSEKIADFHRRYYVQIPVLPVAPSPFYKRTTA